MLTYAALAFLLGGAAVGTVLYFLSGTRADDDRPPIIVRNGSVILEQAPARGRAMYPPWVADGNEYRPDQTGGQSVSAYAVAVVNPASGTCEQWRGHTVRITLSAGPPLVFVIAGGVPKVGPAGILRKDGANSRKLINDNTPQSVHVVSQGGGEQSCSLGATSEVWLWPVQ